MVRDGHGLRHNRDRPGASGAAPHGMRPDDRTVPRWPDQALRHPDGGRGCHARHPRWQLSSACSGRRAVARPRSCGFSPGWSRASAGRVTVAGRDITDTPTHQRDFGMVFQSLALFPHLSVCAERRLSAEGPGPVEGRVPGRAGGIAGSRAAFRAWPTGASTSFPAGSGSAWRSRGALPSTRRCSCWTSRFRRSTPICASTCRWNCASCSKRLGVTTVVVTHDQKEALTMADTVIVMDVGPGAAGRHPDGGLPRPRQCLRRRLHRHLEPAALHAAGWRHGRGPGQTVTLAPEDRSRRPGPAVLSVRPEDVRLGAAG